MRCPILYTVQEFLPNTLVQNCRVPAACLNVKPRHIVKHALVGLLRRQARSNGDYYDDKPVPMGSLRAYLCVHGSRLILSPHIQPEMLFAGSDWSMDRSAKSGGHHESYLLLLERSRRGRYALAWDAGGHQALGKLQDEEKLQDEANSEYR